MTKQELKEWFERRCMIEDVLWKEWEKTISFFQEGLVFREADPPLINYKAEPHREYYGSGYNRREDEKGHTMIWAGLPTASFFMQEEQEYADWESSYFGGTGYGNPPPLPKPEMETCDFCMEDRVKGTLKDTYGKRKICIPCENK